MDLKFSLDRIIQLENEEVWMKKKEPTKFGEDKDSPFHAIYMVGHGKYSHLKYFIEYFTAINGKMYKNVAFKIIYVQGNVGQK